MPLARFVGKSRQRNCRRGRAGQRVECRPANVGADDVAAEIAEMQFDIQINQVEIESDQRRAVAADELGGDSDAPLSADEYSSSWDSASGAVQVNAAAKMGTVASISPEMFYCLNSRLDHHLRLAKRSCRIADFARLPRRVAKL